MDAAIIALWTIGLVGALIPTILILKLGLLVIVALRDILRLSILTAAAAHGIAANVASIESIPDLAPAAEGLGRAARQVCTVMHSVAERLERA
jgi:hypothetical protein